MSQSKPMGGTELMKDWLITGLEKKKTNLLKKTQILLFDAQKSDRDILDWGDTITLTKTS